MSDAGAEKRSARRDGGHREPEWSAAKGADVHDVSSLIVG